MEENSEANPSRESFLKKKMKRFHKKQKLKTQILSRIRRFIRRGAIQLKAKFALGYLR
jgi:hypothetical protein